MGTFDSSISNLISLFVLCTFQSSFTSPYPMSKLSTALVTLTLSDKSLSALRSAFKTVHYHPAGSDQPSPSVLQEVEIVFGPPQRLAPIKTLDELPKLRYIQLGSAGADHPLATPILKDWLARSEQDKAGRDVKMMTASGTHVLSIPPWAVGCVIMLYHQLPRMLAIARVRLRVPSRDSSLPYRMADTPGAE